MLLVSARGMKSLDYLPFPVSAIPFPFHSSLLQQTRTILSSYGTKMSSNIATRLGRGVYPYLPLATKAPRTIWGTLLKV